VPGSISPDLVAAAGEEDMLEMSQSADVDIAVIQAIDTYIKQLHIGFVPTQSHMSRTLWRFLDRNSLPSEHIEAKVMEFLRKGVLTKRQTINGQGQELVTTEINVEHPLVLKALPGIAEALPVEPPAIEASLDDDETEDEESVALDAGLPGEPGATVPEGWEPASEPSRYQRRFSSGTGAWRGKSNVRNGSRPE
jgi:hypothetical protein